MPMSTVLSWPTAGLVLLAPGGTTPAAAAPLAEQLGLRLLLEPHTSQQDPAEILAALAGEPPGWLLPLALDPGADLEVPGCWADVLGAWRQPVLLLLPAAAAAAGPARAYRALLDQAGVPLVGLVQEGTPWHPEPRRRDGLPWLGWLVAEPADPGLPLLVRRRWAGLQRVQA